MYFAKKSLGTVLVAIKFVDRPSVLFIAGRSASEGKEYRDTIWFASLLSEASDWWSRTRYIRSNLESRVGGNLIFSTTDLCGLYLDSIGLAAAKIAVLAFKVQMIPDFATETVYYSIASCKIFLVLSSILSNSSMQQIPRSDRTNAPLSSMISFVSGSFVI